MSGGASSDAFELPALEGGTVLPGVGQAAPLRPAGPRREIAQCPLNGLALPICEPTAAVTGAVRSRS
ncbi:hypothetical protein GCM10020256_04170 [Streptomyces thermocoprophilus]